MSVSLTSSLTDDNDNDGKADAGDSIRYLVEITHSDGSAAVSSLLDTRIDPNVTLIPGSVESSTGTIEKGNGEGDTTV